MNPDAVCYTPWGLFQYFFQMGSADCEFVLQQPAWIPEATWAEYLLYFGLTCALEAPFYLALRSLSFKKRLLAILVLNLATHPAVTFALPHLFTHANAAQMVLGLETFAPLVEALILKFGFKVRAVEAFGIAILANLASWWIGMYLPL